jgi:glutamate synthase domain-containing protein 3
LQIEIILFYRKYVEEGLPDKSIIINLKGSGGQSFCAFMVKGVHVTLEGDANDYVGKVMLILLINYDFIVIHVKIN